MQNTWRWDQGRLNYFAFDNLRAIAAALVGFDGQEINPIGVDPMRLVLQNQTQLSFSPGHYRVWRNYSRVFGCSLLATKAGKYTYVSEICKRF